MQRFDSFINSCLLIDPPLGGRRYTWSNKRDLPSLARLDRFLFNTAWDDLHPSSHQSGLFSFPSDHCPILLSVHSHPPSPKSFRFENMWVLEPGFDLMLANLWCSFSVSGSPNARFVSKLRLLRKRLKSWSSNLWISLNSRKVEL